MLICLNVPLKQKNKVVGVMRKSRKFMALLENGFFVATAGLTSRHSSGRTVERHASLRGRGSPSLGTDAELPTAPQLPHLRAGKPTEGSVSLFKLCIQRLLSLHQGARTVAEYTEGVLGLNRNRWDTVALEKHPLPHLHLY